MVATRTGKSDRLLRTLGDRSVLIVTHDNPDPDAIATGWALRELLRARGGSARLIGRGAVVRAENVQMLRLLQPPLELVDELRPNGDAVVLVDCVPTAGNHLLRDSAVSPLAVIDHHELDGRPFRVRFRDIRPRAAASATIAAGYLREQALEPERDLATALLFAIRTETVGHPVRLTRADRGIIAWLSAFADHTKLVAIHNAPLPRPYFSDLLLALENTFVYDDAAVRFLPQASGHETVGELADMLIRCEGIERVLCAAAVGDDLILSTRTTDAGGDAVGPLGTALHGRGHWGGHRQRAGGKVAQGALAGSAPESLQNEIKERWLSCCRVEQPRGTRLVRRQAILENL